MVPTLASTVLAALLSLSPLAAPHEQIPGWEETAEARGERYRSIAADVAAVAETACSLSVDPSCAFGAAAELVGVAVHESGLAVDVDRGPCYRGRDGHSPRCDGGAAISLWQQRTAGEERELYLHDRRAAAAGALRRIWRSMGACRSMAPALRLSAYAGGRCTDIGRSAEASREIWADITAARSAMRRAAAAVQVQAAP